MKIINQNSTRRTKKISNDLHGHDNQNRVSCNGSKEGSPHPLIYLSLEKTKSVICPYCSKVFSKKSD